MSADLERASSYIVALGQLPKKRTEESCGGGSFLLCFRKKEEESSAIPLRVTMSRRRGGDIDVDEGGCLAVGV